MLRGGRPDYRTHPGQVAFPPGEPIGETIHDPGEMLVNRAFRGREVLDIGGARVAGPDQGEDSGAGGLSCLDHRFQGIDAKQRIGGEGIGPQTGNRTERRLCAADHGLPVGLGRNGNIAAFAVGDHEETGVPSRRAYFFEGFPARPAQPFEAGQLRLHRDTEGPCKFDDPAAVGRDSGTCGFRRRSFCPVGDRITESGRIRIQAEADLAATLFYERRSLINEEAQPLTCFFRADPAEKRGTLPPAMVMRSPVRGLTP